MQPADQMAELDGAAEQAVAVEVAPEHADPAAAGEVATIPVVADRGLESRLDEPLVEAEVVARVGLGEEAAEGLVVRQMAGGSELELEQGDMGGIEVDRLDPHRVGGEIAHHVAAARGDRDQPAGGPELQGRHVDLGILPDLGVDQPFEQLGEDALQDAALGDGRGLQGRVANEGVGQWALLLRGSD